jgi:outer membrane protein TolC
MNLNFWRTSSEVRVAHAELLQLAQQETQLIRGLELEARKTYVELRQAQLNMRDSERAARTGANWLRSATMTFDIGVGEVKDLIDAFKANTAIQAEHLQNVFNFNVALAKLSQVIGRDVYPN